MLASVGESNKSQALRLAARFITRCNRDCARLLKGVTTHHRGVAQTASGLKRTHSHSSNSFGHSGDNSGGNRTDWTDARPRKRQKQQPSYGFSDSDEEAETLPASSLPSAAVTPDPAPNPQYAFLHALLTVVSPACLMGAKDWISHRTGAPGPSDKHAHALVFRIEELEWRMLLLVQEMDRGG